MWRRLVTIVMLFPVLAVAMDGEFVNPDDLRLKGVEVHLHGRIINRACEIAADSKPVDMGVISVKELQAGTGTKVPFFIRLTNCRSDIFRVAKVSFTGLRDQKLKGGLAFSSGSAKGAGIRLYDESGPISLGSISQSYKLKRWDASNELQFFARVETSPNTMAKHITLGDFSAVAYFSVTYE